MTIFLKYLVRSIIKSKFKAIMVLFSIVITTALLFSSLGLTKSLTKMNIENLKGSLGDTDIIIAASKNSPSPFFEYQNINKEYFEIFFPTLDMYGNYIPKNNDDEVIINIKGMDFGDIGSLNNTYIAEEKDLKPFKGRKIVLSNRTMKKYNLNLGDTFNIVLNEKKEIFKIAGVSSDDGFFKEEKSGKIIAITPLETAGNIMGVDSKATSIFSKVKGNYTKDQVLKSLNQNDHILASLAIDEDLLNEYNQSISGPLFFMLFFVLVMCSFIIYTSFKLIAIERLPVIGTFLSQGATRSNINVLLLLESALIGLVGGVLGGILGVGALYLITDANNQLKEFGVKTVIEIDPMYMAISIIFAVFLSVISSILPILSVNKKSIKDIILNTIFTKERKPFLSWIVGALMVVFGLVASKIAGENYKDIVSLVSIFLISIGMILLIPKIVEIISVILQKTISLFGNLFKLSVHNVSTSKIYSSSIRLLSFCIITSLIVVSIAKTISNELEESFSAFDADIYIDSFIDFEKVDEVLNKDSRVKDIYYYFNTKGSIKGEKERIHSIQGIDISSFKKFNKAYKFDDNSLETLKENEDNILFSQSILKKFNKNIGDTITLIINNREKEYKISGSFDAGIDAMGNVALINKKDMDEFFNIKIPMFICINVIGDQTIVKKDLSKKLIATNSIVTTSQDKKSDNEKMISGIINILSIFSISTIVIGGLGIFNNIAIGYIQRRREFAVLSSIGMTKSGKNVMLFIESIYSGLLGVLIGGITSVIIINLLTNVFKLIGVSINVNYDIYDVILYSTIGVLVVLIGTIVMLIKYSKNTILQDIK